MVLVKIYIVLVALHVACGFTQISVTYFGADSADVGLGQFLDKTPLGPFIDNPVPKHEFGTALSEDEGGRSLLGAAMSIFRTVARVGATIDLLVIFDYGFMKLAGPGDGLAYAAIASIRIIAALVGIAGVLATLYVLFDSGLMNNKLVQGGVAITGLLSAVGLTAL